MNKKLILKSVTLGVVLLFFAFLSSGICGSDLSINVTGGDWDMGEIFQNQSTSTAADFWEIRTSEDSEGYKISVDISVSSGTHSPSLTGDSGENIFLLREGDSEGPIISTTPVQLTEIIGENTYGLGLYFKAPSEDSVPSAESLSLTIYAEWELHQFEVTLDDQEGSGGSGTVTATYGSPMPAAAKPTRTDFIFEGYYDAAGGAGTKYYNENMSSANNWDKTSAATLYAYWTLPPRFTDNGNETVTDNQTGLMWAKDTRQGGAGMSWDDAQIYVENLDLGGYTDWRLPTVEKLDAISGTTHPAELELVGRINADPEESWDYDMLQEAFNMVNADWTWSGTGSMTTAWSFNQINGGMDEVDKSLFLLSVWPVRSDER